MEPTYSIIQKTLKRVMAWNIFNKRSLAPPNMSSNTISLKAQSGAIYKLNVKMVFGCDLF